MKYNEKLIELRKKEGLSQEELGYRLNVTRQTISKWELGQTTPEMEKIIEISKIFNISVDELINSSENKEIEEKKEIKQESTTSNVNEKNVNTKKENKTVNENGKSNRETIIKIGLIILLIIVVLGIFYSINEKRKEKAAEKLINGTVDTINKDRDNALDIFGNMAESMYDSYEKNKEESRKKTEEQYKKNREESEKKFEEEVEKLSKENDKNHNNSVLEMYSGEKTGFFVKILCEEVNKINKKETEKIEVKYGDIVTTDERTIIDMKQKFEEHKKYEVILDYSQDGYVNKVEIQNI